MTMRYLNLNPFLAQAVFNGEKTEIRLPVAGKYESRNTWKVGDKIWIREAFRIVCPPDKICDKGSNKLMDCQDCKGKKIQYKAVDSRLADDWRLSSCMPRWAGRMMIKIEDVRIENLQKITEDEAIAEGIVAGFVELPTPLHSTLRYIAPGVVMTNGEGERDNYAPAHCSARAAFEVLWDNGPGKKAGLDWDSNPLVWVLGFKRIS